MKSLLILFAIVAVVAANPEPERERRGILGVQTLAAPLIAPRIAAPIGIVAGPKLLAAPAVVAGPAIVPSLGLKGW